MGVYFKGTTGSANFHQGWTPPLLRVLDKTLKKTFKSLKDTSKSHHHHCSVFVLDAFHLSGRELTALFWLSSCDNLLDGWPESVWKKCYSTFQAPVRTLSEAKSYRAPTHGHGPPFYSIAVNIVARPFILGPNGWWLLLTVSPVRSAYSLWVVGNLLKLNWHPNWT